MGADAWQVLEGDVENEITVTVFRLLVLDLLALFQALNQGMINILGTLRGRNANLTTNDVRQLF